jgi:hypothetical protein
MNAPSDRQLAFIRSLAAERTEALAADTGILSTVVETTRDASALIERLMALPRDPQPEDEANRVRIEALRGALPTLNGRDAEFAMSLVAQFDRKGSLSERQWPHVDRLAAGPAPAVTLEPGVFVLDDGTMILVYTTRNGHLAGKVFDGERFVYESGAQRRAATGRLITAEEAAAFGHATGHCVYCSRELTDDRSVEVGYGPVCAEKNGLPWGVAV